MTHAILMNAKDLHRSAGSKAAIRLQIVVQAVGAGCQSSDIAVRSDSDQDTALALSSKLALTPPRQTNWVSATEYD